MTPEQITVLKAVLKVATSRLDAIERRLEPLEINVLNHEWAIGKAQDRFQRHTHKTYSSTSTVNAL